MGLGFKDFTAGDVLTAAQVDGYLMRQTIMVFASTSARDTALSGNLEEGMFAFTTDTDSVYYYDGSAWQPFSTAWTSFTPTWTNFTIGNGTQTASYRYIPGGMWVDVTVTLGSTSSVSGNIQMTLPDSASTVGRGRGAGTAFDGTRLYPLVSYYISATAIGLCHAESGGNGVVNATAPFTFGTGDNFGFTVFVPL